MRAGRQEYSRAHRIRWHAANRLVAINYTGTAKRSEFTYEYNAAGNRTGTIIDGSEIYGERGREKVRKCSRSSWSCVSTVRRVVRR